MTSETDRKLKNIYQASRLIARTVGPQIGAVASKAAVTIIKGALRGFL